MECELKLFDIILYYYVFMFEFPYKGDQVSRRGALTGGYYDTRKSRLDLQKSKIETLHSLQQHEREYEEHKIKLQNILFIIKYVIQSVIS